MNNYTDYLSHHGIKGQKWGVRRYQNPDGSLTPAGEKRQGRNIAKKVAIGTSAVVTAAYLANHPDQARRLLSATGKAGKSIYSGSKETFIKGAPKVGAYVGRKLGNTSKRIESRADQAVDKVIDAALLSIGSMAVSKLVDKYSEANAVTESQKNRNKFVRDVGSVVINTMTKESSNGNNKKGSKTSTNISGKELTNKLGKPSNKSINKNTDEWRSLFVDENGKSRDADTRAMIKTLANKGYDIEQINKYLKHDDYLSHHGIKGQKWGVRRYQNPDGSLTPAGEKRQGRTAQSAMRGERIISGYAPTTGKMATSLIGRQYVMHRATAKIANIMKDIGYEQQAKTLTNAYRTLAIADVAITTRRIYDVNNYYDKYYR